MISLIITNESFTVASSGLSLLQSSAIYANRLYLSLFNETHKERLASGPNVTGLVRIHPTAHVDASAKVSGISVEELCMEWL